MGALLSRLLGRKRGYEHVLEQLEATLRHEETLEAELRMARRRWGFNSLVWGVLLWIAAAVYVWLLAPPAFTTSTRFWRNMPLWAVPLGVVILRFLWLLQYDWRLRWSLQRLDLAKQKQKDKVEELKKATSFYQTKSLLDRFDPDVRPTTPKRGRSQPVLLPEGPSLQPGEDPPPQQQQSQPQLPQQEWRQPRERTWLDKVVDSLVGDGPNNRYALICARCYAHNGLAVKEEVEMINYVCPYCGFLNGPTTPVVAEAAAAVPAGPVGAEEPPTLAGGGPRRRRGGEGGEE